jgi:hypothetical protein
MRREAELKQDEASYRFQDNMFLHSIAGHSPGLYNELFGEDTTVDEIDEWEVPDSLDDLRRMQQDLAEVGVAMDFSGVRPDIQGG